jgi:hypothetical protein
MATHAITTGDNETVTTAQRLIQNNADWAEEHVDVVVNGGSSTQPASFSGTVIDHEIVWTKNGRTRVTIVETDGDEEDLAEKVAAVKAKIIDAGGTIVSG